MRTGCIVERISHCSLRPSRSTALEHPVGFCVSRAPTGLRVRRRLPPLAVGAHGARPDEAHCAAPRGQRADAHLQPQPCDAALPFFPRRSRERGPRGRRRAELRPACVSSSLVQGNVGATCHSATVGGRSSPVPGRRGRDAGQHAHQARDSGCVRLLLCLPRELSCCVATLVSAAQQPTAFRASWALLRQSFLSPRCRSTCRTVVRGIRRGGGLFSIARINNQHVRRCGRQECFVAGQHIAPRCRWSLCRFRNGACYRQRHSRVDGSVKP